MYTFMFQNDNSIVLTECTSGVVEKTNSIDALKIIVPKLYDEIYDMTSFDGILEYLTPISKTNGIYQLALVDDNYKEDYLLYTLPDTTMTTALTAEVGELQFSLTFIRSELNEDGNTIDRVRQSIAPAFIKIIPVSSWLKDNNPALTTLAELYTQNKHIANALIDVANGLNTEKADGIVLNTDEGKIQLTSNGIALGDGISLEELNQELVTKGSSSPQNGNILIQQI